MKLSATWRGDLPQIGDYVRSQRGRFAYRVVGVHVIAECTIEDGEMTHLERRANFYVERIAAADLPPASTVHPWRWAPRAPKRATTNHRRRP